MADEVSSTGGGGKRRKRVPWRIVALVAGVLLVIVAAWFGAKWLSQRDSNQQKASPKGVSETVALSDKQLSQLDYDGARQTVDEALTNPELSVEAKYGLYMQRALVHVNQQNYEAALKDYETAWSYHESVALAESIASLAMRIGNTELALEYYKKTLELLPDDETAGGQMNREYFENWVAHLERELNGEESNGD